MTQGFIRNATVNGLKGLGNTLLNGFASDISKYDKISLVGIKATHFIPSSRWTPGLWNIVDQTTNEGYCDDSKTMIRRKCAAVFGAALVVQPIALLLNLLNRIGKIVTFAHLWNRSSEKYSFKARTAEWATDLLRVVLIPLILVGMIFSALYGAAVSPYDGRKLYASFERFAFSGGYQFFKILSYRKLPHNFLLAPCFQPSPQVHLGGGVMGEKNVW